jgi:cytidylate kinase
MPIILCSCDCYRTGRSIGEAVAEAAGYDYVDREILGEIAERTSIEKCNLESALEPAPGIWGFPSKNQIKYLYHIQEAALGRLLADKAVSHGLAAHLYVLGVSHALKVRILADPGQRINRLTSETGAPPAKAEKMIKQQDARRKKWSLKFFNLDETDPSNYDTVLNMSQIEPDEAVRSIVDMISYRRFQPMTYSIKCLKDRALGSRVRIALLDQFPDVQVKANGGTIIVESRAIRRNKQKKVETIKDLAKGVEGVDYVEVHMANKTSNKSDDEFP